MKKYIISQYGIRTAVGLLDEQAAETDINLAHNLFNTYVNDNYFHGVLCFASEAQFYKFLIYKSMFNNKSEITKYRTRLKQAAIETRKVLNNDVYRQNFMIDIVQRENVKYHIYKYQKQETK